MYLIYQTETSIETGSLGFFLTLPTITASEMYQGIQPVFKDYNLNP